VTSGAAPGDLSQPSQPYSIFQTKLEIALGQIRPTMTEGIPLGTVLADPAYVRL